MRKKVAVPAIDFSDVWRTVATKIVRIAANSARDVPSPAVRIQLTREQYGSKYFALL